MNDERPPTPRNLTCERFAELSLEALEGALPPAEAERFRAHRESCAACRAEFEELSRTWRDLGDLAALDSPSEVPTERLRRGLDRVLAAERATERAKQVLAFPARAVASRPALAPLAPWIAGLAAALFAGLWLGARLERGGADTRALEAEVGSLRQMVALSMLQQPAASERLLGVRYGREIAQPGSNVVGTLFEVVRNDANVNVRLAAVEALTDLLGSDAGSVSSGLFDSFSEVSSPLVQAAIAAALLDQPKTRTEAERRFLELLAEGKLNPATASFLRRRLGVSA